MAGEKKSLHVPVGSPDPTAIFFTARSGDLAGTMRKVAHNGLPYIFFKFSFVPVGSPDPTATTFSATSGPVRHF